MMSEEKINQLSELDREWFKGRPKEVQEAVLQNSPLYWYILKKTGQTVRIHSYCETEEGVKCRIIVDGNKNPGMSVHREIIEPFDFDEIEQTKELIQEEDNV